MTRPINLLFLCNGNSARSIMAEALAAAQDCDVLHVYSAGVRPAGAVSPVALAVLAERGHPTAGLRPKSWDEFAGPHGPEMDIVVTLCDQAASEPCPLWPGSPLRVHWSLPDPAHVQGEAARHRAFEACHDELARLIGDLVQVLRTSPDRAALSRRLAAIRPDMPPPERNA
jgi:arsenate reductase